MNQRSLFRLMLRPSILSGTVVVMTAIGILGYTTWLYLNNNQRLYSTLFGSYGLQDFITQNTQGFMTWQKVFFASPVAYYVLVAGVAVAAGMAVFTILQVIGSLFRSTTSFVHQAAQGGRGRVAFLGEQLTKLCLRLLALVGWAVYMAAFLSMILPFAILLNQNGVEGINQAQYTHALYCAGAFLLLLLALHLQIVFARMLVLRPRVFGGDAEIAASEVH